jgi:hypothetical protein
MELSESMGPVADATKLNIIRARLCAAATVNVSVVIALLSRGSKAPVCCSRGEDSGVHCTGDMRRAKCFSSRRRERESAAEERGSLTWKSDKFIRQPTLRRHKRQLFGFASPGVGECDLSSITVWLGTQILWGNSAGRASSVSARRRWVCQIIMRRGSFTGKTRGLAGRWRRARALLSRQAQKGGQEVEPR